MNTKSWKIRSWLLAAASVGLVALGWAGCSTASKATSAAASAAGADVPQLERHTLKPSMIDESWSFLEESDKKKGDKEGKEGSESKTAEKGDESSKEGEDKPKNPFATEEHKLQYATIGMKKYDNFFKRSSKLFGKTVLADQHTKRFKKTVNSGIIKKMVSGEMLTDLLNVGSEELSFQDRKKIVQYTFQGKFDKIASDVSAVSKDSITKFQKNLYKEYPNLEKVAKWQGPVMKTFKPKKLKKEATQLVQKSKKLAKSAPDDFTDEKAAVVPDLTKELKKTGERLKSSSERIPKIGKRMGETTDSLVKRIKKAGKQEMSAK